MKGGHKSHHHGKHRKAGGRTDMLVSGNPDVVKEAEEKKHGGKVKKHVGKMEGEHSKHRMDRRGRKSGGRVGADKAPLSSANKSTASEPMPKSDGGN